MSRARSQTPLTTIMVSAFLFLIETTASASDLLPELVPGPQLGADEVVRIQLGALAQNDTPHPDAGIEITFRFASPENKKRTGPLPRFVELVKNPVYGPMVNHQSAEYGNPVTQQDRVMIPVLLTAEDGGKAAYVFSVGKQSDGCEGCWMTEGVFRIDINQVQPGSSTPAEIGT